MNDKYDLKTSNLIISVIVFFITCGIGLIIIWDSNLELTLPWTLMVASIIAFTTLFVLE